MKVILAIIFSLSAASLALAQATPQAAGAEDAPRAVVELFTSQGCSSCPPADALMGKLAQRAGLLVLSFPVDYWDYLGWKDTLALPGFTARQRSYAKARGDGQIYTPQAIINGMVHVNGSKESEIEAAVRRTLKELEPRRVALKAWGDKDTIHVQAGAAPSGLTGEASGTIYLAVVQRRAEVAIDRGENRGRKVEYTNVVRQWKAVGAWNGSEVVLKLPRTEVMRDNMDFCTALLQQGKAGPILAAADIKSW